MNSASMVERLLSAEGVWRGKVGLNGTKKTKYTPEREVTYAKRRPRRRMGVPFPQRRLFALNVVVRKHATCKVWGMKSLSQPNDETFGLD